MPRGDLKHVGFSVSFQNGDQVDDFDEIYMTVKRSAEHPQFIFQKSLSKGTIERTDPGEYQFEIEPEDTDNLPYGTYVFDIELIKKNEIKTTFVGKFIITHEVTFAGNEE